MPALPALAIAATVASVAIGTATAISSAQQQKAAANYNAQMSQYNAEIQNKQGQQDAQEQENQGELIMGKARAAAAASGLSGGSSTDIQYNDLVTNDENAFAAKYRGEIGAYNADSQASLDSFSANNAQTNGYLGAGGALLSGASKIYGQTNSSPTPGGIFAGSTTENQPGF